MELGFIAVTDMGRSLADVQMHADARSASHVLLIRDERPLTVVSIEEIRPRQAPVIGSLVDLGDQLHPAPADIELGSGLTRSRLYVGQSFAVDMRAEPPLVLLGENRNRSSLLHALRTNSFMLAMADPRLPGKPEPLPPDPVFLRCPVGPHSVLAPPGTAFCPEHGAQLSQ